MRGAKEEGSGGGDFFKGKRVASETFAYRVCIRRKDSSQCDNQNDNNIRVTIKQLCCRELLECCCAKVIVCRIAR